MQKTIEGSVVTITGGTGSFGTTMVREVLSRSAAEVRVFSRDEAKQDALRHSINDDRVRFYIGDTREMQSVRSAIKGSDFVFHAAALKQVPSAEFFPLEAVKTNILGSANVLQASIESEVSSIVCLSTDKAVYPINAMGQSKAMMEKTAIAAARESLGSATRISVTRYGNVMYSRGSVIPLFISQLKQGASITVTDPNMTRFLMSLRQSVELVVYAMEQGNSGDLFVRKAPAATIGDLASAISELMGIEAKPPKQIGFRHGEKLYESLLSTEERAIAIDEGDYFRVPMDTRDLNYKVFFEQGEERSPDLESYTSHNTERLSVDEIKNLLLTLPEVREELAK